MVIESPAGAGVPRWSPFEPGGGWSVSLSLRCSHRSWAAAGSRAPRTPSTASTREALNWPGYHRFNVALNDKRVLNHYDIFAEVGANTGTVQTFDVTTSDGINVELTHVAGRDNPKISGISVDLLGSTPTTTTTTTTLPTTTTTTTTTLPTTTTTTLPTSTTSTTVGPTTTAAPPTKRRPFLDRGTARVTKGR
jgi:hypothetical protein